MLVAKLLGSRHAHAKVGTIALDAAREMDGVLAVLEVIDDPHRVARYAGYPLVPVAAVDEETAVRALRAIDVQYEPRPFVVDASDALQPDAPEVFPEPDKHPKNASEGPIPPARWKGNIRIPVLNKMLSHRKSQAQKHLARARDGDEDLLLVDRVYHTGGQTRATLEPHCALAYWEGDHLTVHTSIQSVHQTMQELAEHFELKESQVSVHSEFIGGAFGGKQGLQLESSVAARLARVSGRPVKLALDREEEMVRGGYRPLTRFETAIVSNADLEPLGITLRGYGAAGVAVQSQAAALLRMTYRGPKNLQDFDIVTNTGPGRPMRAPSGPPAFWALESAMDEMAHLAGSDPVALRSKWDDSDVREHLYDWVDSIPEWKERGLCAYGSGRYRSGIGFAVGNWLNIFHNETKVRLDAGRQGVVARCAVQDMGNGARSVIAKAIAETLGIEFAAVTVDVGVSDHPPGPNSSASRTTASVYPTSIEAAEFLQQALVKHAKKQGFDAPRWVAGGVQHAAGFVPLNALLALLPEPVSVTSKRRGGNSTLDLLGKLPSGRMGASIFPKMTGAVAVVAVEVDTKLGRVKPQKVWLGMSVGKIVNPAIARSQAYGGVIQCLGAALTEERHYDPATGQLLSANLEDHRLPGMGDVPPIEVFFDESKFKKMRGGACGLSELSALPTQAALGNAVFHATGWRPTHLPLRPQRVQTNVAHLAE
ncbi:MAG: xanthine dehydrogenase family protein molybdopterin-binding subunit [Sandaracinaceae bacterium]